MFMSKNAQINNDSLSVRNLEREKQKDVIETVEYRSYNSMCNIVCNLEEFSKLSEDYKFSKVREFVRFNGNSLIGNIEKMGIKNIDYKVSLACDLLKYNYGDNLIDNIDKFALDKKSLEYVLNMAVDFDYGYSLIDNIDRFYLLDEMSKFNLAKKLISNFSAKLSDNIDKFNINTFEYKFVLAKTLIKKNSSYFIKNLHKFNFDKAIECQLLEEFAIFNENRFLVLLKLQDLDSDCFDKTIIYMNRVFNILISKNSSNMCADIETYKNLIIDKTYVWGISNVNEYGNINSIFDKTIKNLETLNKFIFDIKKEPNFDMAKILGEENADIIKNEINNIKDYRVKLEINDIVEKILFSYENIYQEYLYQDELTELIVEIIVMRDPILKKKILPLAIKYISDDNLKCLSGQNKNKKRKSINAISEVLFERFSLYDEENYDLLCILRKKFRSSNFLRNSINVRRYIETFVELDKLDLDINETKSILKFLISDTANITRNVKYILNIIELGHDEKLALIKENSDKYALKDMFYDLYKCYLKMDYGADFINLYDEFVSRKENVKRKLEEYIMMYITKINSYPQLMELMRSFLSTMYDINRFRELRYNLNSSKHLRCINKMNAKVYEKWVKVCDEYKEDMARITDDPVDLFLIGTEIDNSCQRIDGSIAYNKCLLGYVMDGKNKAVVVSCNNRIVARSIIRLLIDEYDDEIVMFMERPYKVNGILKKELIKLKKRCIEYAKEIGISLLCEDEDANEKCTKELISKSGMAPYEYFDITRSMADDNGGYYFINKSLVYLYKKDT